MALQTLFEAGPVIAGHAIVAVMAIPLGAAQFALPKGTSLHRGLGLAWVAAMVIIGVSGFFIHDIRTWGLFSPIHFLSLLILATLFVSYRAARRGDIQRHKYLMIALYGLGLIVAGGFTLAPGRVMHAALFGGPFH